LEILRGLTPIVVSSWLISVRICKVAGTAVLVKTLGGVTLVFGQENHESVELRPSGTRIPPMAAVITSVESSSIRYGCISIPANSIRKNIPKFAMETKIL
jgi:hypothetical protein